MRHKLAVVTDAAAQSGTLLLMGGDGVEARIASYEEQDIDVPQISLALHEYFAGIGELAKTKNGLLPVVWFYVMDKGERRCVLGVAVPLTSGALVRLPVGYLASERGKQGLDATKKTRHSLRSYSDCKIYQVPG